jgi:hypothetical protein
LGGFSADPLPAEMRKYLFRRRRQRSEMMLYGQGMTLAEAQQHFSDMLDELSQMGASPWPYLCASAMLEYLSKMSIDRTGLSGASAYIRFVDYYMPQAYRDYKFDSGDQDLPYQMYYVLRCGIVHSFSLVPDPNIPSAARGRKGSIVISHKGKHHLSKFRYTKNPDAVLFLFDEFCADIRSALDEVFRKAQSDNALMARITKFVEDNPPIQELSPGTAVSGVFIL